MLTPGVRKVVGFDKYPVHRWVDGRFVTDHDLLADESLVHVVVNERRITSLLASNADLVDLGVGHLATEYVDNPTNIATDPSVSNVGLETTVNVRVDVDTSSWISRDRLVTTSCGACEQDELPGMLATARSVDPSSTPLSMATLEAAFDSMREKQHGFHATGGLHAAGLLYDTHHVEVREDIGRHNAVDKVIGAHLLQGQSSRPLALLLSGRCGWDIVAKASKINIPLIASIGAASSLATQAARESNITLVSFMRKEQAVVIGPLHGRLQEKD